MIRSSASLNTFLHKKAFIIAVMDILSIFAAAFFAQLLPALQKRRAERQWKKRFPYA
jgi:hypothetical protein